MSLPELRALPGARLRRPRRDRRGHARARPSPLVAEAGARARGDRSSHRHALTDRAEETLEAVRVRRAAEEQAVSAGALDGVAAERLERDERGFDEGLRFVGRVEDVGAGASRLDRQLVGRIDVGGNDPFGAVVRAAQAHHWTPVLLHRGDELAHGGEWKVHTPLRPSTSTETIWRPSIVASPTATVPPASASSMTRMPIAFAYSKSVASATRSVAPLASVTSTR